LALKHRLKDILLLTREQWDKEALRPEVRTEFQKVIACRTPALGAEVYASSSGEERVVFHTCKSRACPSCGQRANLNWLRQRSADLPDIPYSHVTLTMPDVFWPLLKGNRDLLKELPAIGAEVIKRWFRVKYRAQVLIAVMPHTFGKDLKFNCHLHILVSQGGLKEDRTAWQRNLPFYKEPIMRMWRYAVVYFLRAAYRRKLLSTPLGPAAFKRLPNEQYGKYWHIDCKSLGNKWQILSYGGRYARRPPIAEHKLVKVDEREVTFLIKDTERRQSSNYSLTINEFIERLGHHVPDRYSNNVRYFGLLAPRTKAKLYDFIFSLLRQKRRPKPRPLSWAISREKCFGVNPLIDSKGQPMHWAGRIKAVPA